MRRLSLPLSLPLSGLLALTLAACPGPEGDPAPPDTTGPAPEAPAAVEIDRSTIELPVAEDPSIVYAAWFQVGSQDDPPGKEGLAWLTAQLITNGGSESRSYQELLEFLYPMAAGWGVRVDREMTTITGRSHKETADAFQALLTEQWTKPAFDQADFERLRTQGINALEKNLRYAQDEELGKFGLEAFVYAGTPYAHPPQGSVAGLKSITLEDVRAFFEAHYTQDRVVFAMGGGYSPEQLAAVEASAKALPEAASAAPTPPPAPAAIEGKHVLLIQKPGADASISFGHPIDLHRGEADFYALWLANSWLGEHRNSASHLYGVIREARGLNYGDYSYIEAYPEGGFRSMPPTNVSRRAQLFQVWIRTLPNEHAHFALRAAHRELTLLVENGLTKEQFELTRDFLRKYILHFADTTSGRLGYAIDDRFYGLDRDGGPGHLADFQAALDTMTLEQVNAAIKKYIDPDNLKITIATGEAESLRDALVADAPGTIEYPTPKPQAILDEDQVIGAHELGISAENVTIRPVDEMFAG
ncbi:peptidase M16-like protein [Plesiocystis pacifica SIR-1]|uniref:Peptidase M16-like protein n=1 Tax=Plesiocystis pacifica SIR-1 TaxID=391625 RepID=A6GGG6_9BACT|nr:pitrilysin family protein [Plesiocystis pacifica]EDM75042.1 peptidase M16-like protein [Plesiocystis pacifica SIR-1]